MQSEVESLCQRLRNYRPPTADGYGYPPGQEPREHHVICDEAASLIESLYRERDDRGVLSAPEEMAFARAIEKLRESPNVDDHRDADLLNTARLRYAPQPPALAEQPR